MKRVSFQIIFERCDIHPCWHLNCCPLPYGLIHIAQCTPCNSSYAAMILVISAFQFVTELEDQTTSWILDNILGSVISIQFHNSLSLLVYFAVYILQLCHEVECIPPFDEEILILIFHFRTCFKHIIPYAPPLKNLNVIWRCAVWYFCNHDIQNVMEYSVWVSQASFKKNSISSVYFCYHIRIHTLRFYCIA